MKTLGSRATASCCAAALLGICLCGVHAFAQEFRPPTPAEDAALKRYETVLHEVLDRFGNDNWEESIDFDVSADLNVHKDPDVPLDIDESMERTYTIRNGSPLYQQEIEPFAQKLESMTDPAEMAKLAAQMKMMRMSVEVHFNRTAAVVNPPPPGNPDLHIPGAAMAYRVSNYKFDKGTSVILLFGDWKNATWRPADGVYRYKFKHGPNQPAIENIEVHFDGSPERINELLRSANWQRLNDALTNP